jgi:multimeric flavodoxin WrbA
LLRSFAQHPLKRVTHSMRHFLFVLGSGRRHANTETLAREAARNLPADANQHWIHLLDYPLAPFEDLRHPQSTYGLPQGLEKDLMEATLAATDLVLVTPLYWYSVSASTKLYLDYWSAWMRAPGVDFRARMAGKTLWLVSTNSDENVHEMATHQVGMLQMCADYMDMHWGGALIGSANRPVDVLQDPKALEQAAVFFH